jgi:hypothetical protein
MNRNDRRIALTAIAIAALALIALWLTENNNRTTAVATAANDSITQQHDTDRKGYYQRSLAITVGDVPTRHTEEFPFDPNTADSTQLLRLGLQPWQVRSIYRYRARGGVFRSKRDFAQLYGLTKKDYLRLEPYIRISDDYSSVTVNEDSTLSFCYCGPGRRVSVQSDLLYADEDSNRYTDHTRRIKMRLQSDGCFHVTTRAVSPETYTYCFRVNGKRKPDPLNPDTAWQKMHKWNVVNVGGSKHADLYRAPLQQGELIHATWYSTNEKLRRRVNIYLPAAFNRQNSDFPVLYLIHGINGYEGSWSERGRAIHILENMVQK